MRDRDMIRAVVLDIGSVLEIIDDSVFPVPFEQRHGLPAGAVRDAADFPGGRGHRFAAQRPARRTGIVSNSGPGAREAEPCWGFEGITDDIVHSHEVGLRKPDPRIFSLAADRLDVRPDEIVFLDDVDGHVEAARAVGYRGVVHRSTPESIAEIEAMIEAEQLR